MSPHRQTSRPSSPFTLASPNALRSLDNPQAKVSKRTPACKMSQQGWCTIESDPGVFTSLLTEMGVEEVQVEELYTLERSHLSSLGETHGLIFLFKHESSASQPTAAADVMTTPPEGLFFARQTIPNACATVALLQIVMNSSLRVGSELTRFREFTGGMDGETVGMVLSNSDKIRGVHNSFSGQSGISVEQSGTATEDAFHFVAYIPYKGGVYELDGLKSGPTRIGGADEGGWAHVAAAWIEKRIAAYGGSEIRFNTLAVVSDRRVGLRRMVAEGTADDGTREMLRGEEAKWERWGIENERRRWNFLPLAVEMCKVLAEAGLFEYIVEGSRRMGEDV